MSQNWNVDQLQVQVYRDAQEIGYSAAQHVAQIINETVIKQGFARIILATGTSQFEFLKRLQEESIDWSKITVFHLDEYKGIRADHPASFRKYLKERILDAVRPHAVHFIQGDDEDLDNHMHQYERLLKEAPVDIGCIGIGENGHIAFNDPPVADFDDPKWVKIVQLDDDCRQQQLGEGWFPTLQDVPTHAITLTIPAIMACKRISCVVPDGRKANAVYSTLKGSIDTHCPATILRNHESAILYLDEASAHRVIG